MYRAVMHRPPLIGTNFSHRNLTSLRFVALSNGSFFSNGRILSSICGMKHFSSAHCQRSRQPDADSQTTRSNISPGPGPQIFPVFYDLVRPEEVEAAWIIEKQGFPSDEADSLETLRFHQLAAPELFLGAFIPSTSNRQGRRLIGYTFATLSPVPRYTQASLTSHVHGTTTVCAHTLCVDNEFRGASIGLKLFAEFIDMCRKRGKYDRIVGMAKESFVPVYERMGFNKVGKAEVTLGKDVWFEVCISFQGK